MAEDLAAPFEPADLDAWRAAAEQASGGGPTATALEDGVRAAWLYTRADELAPDPGGAPGRAPFVRGVRAGLPWDVRQEHAQPERAAANAAILEDLEGGATATALRLDRAAREGLAPDAFAGARGVDGVAVSDLDDLDEVLDGVLLDLAPVALDAGPRALEAGALLAALWRRREVSAPRGSLGCDPLGALAHEGVLDRPAEEAVARAGALAAEVAAGWPGVRALAVDTRAYVEAGASPAQELALAVATGVAYLRAADAAGLEPARAAGQVELTLQVGTDQFLEIAKLRAVRRLWARVLEASGVPPDARWSPTYARTSWRMLSSVDPWVNLLRVTSAAFAAATGGADGLAVTPFDAVGGRPEALGRRIARNTQMVLQEESALGQVADPAAGSWYVESLTDALARAGWEQLQAIERDGGALAVLRSGRLADELAASADRRAAQLAGGERHLTGVNAFPLIGDDGLRRAAPADLDALARLDAARHAEAGEHDAAALARAAAGGRLAAAADLALQGARIDELAAALGGDAVRVAPLRVRREAEPFEALRAAADAHEAGAGEPPRVFLAGVGPRARFSSVVTWATNAFGVGGFHPVVGEPVDEPAALGPAFGASGLALVAVCAGPAEEDEDVAEAVRALREAGAERVYLAQADEARARAAGADEAVHDRTDLLALLADAQRRAGVAPTPGAG